VSDRDVVEILVQDRFLDFFARIMPRSLAFLVGGTLVLSLAWFLESHRGKLGGLR